MTSKYDPNAPIVNRETREHHCFGCGTLNPVGLQLEFRTLQDGVWAECSPDRRFEGYVGMIHGGVLSTMLDEAMSWAINASGEFAITTSLNASFRSPARVGSSLRVEGRIVSRGRRLITTSAVITDVNTGSRIAEAEGQFMRVPAEKAQAWSEAYFGTESA